MKPETFNALLSNLKRDTSDTDLNLGMRAKRQNYELNVYCVDGGEMEVECYDNDIEVNLTDSAIEKIKTIFDAELEQVEINFKLEEAYNNDDGFGNERDTYESTGTRPSDFY